MNIHFLNENKFVPVNFKSSDNTINKTKTPRRFENLLSSYDAITEDSYAFSNMQNKLDLKA